MLSHLSKNDRKSGVSSCLPTCDFDYSSNKNFASDSVADAPDCPIPNWTKKRPSRFTYLVSGFFAIVLGMVWAFASCRSKAYAADRGAPPPAVVVVQPSAPEVRQEGRIRERAELYARAAEARIADAAADGAAVDAPEGAEAELEVPDANAPEGAEAEGEVSDADAPEGAEAEGEVSDADAQLAEILFLLQEGMVLRPVTGEQENQGLTFERPIQVLPNQHILHPQDLVPSGDNVNLSPWFERVTHLDRVADYEIRTANGDIFCLPVVYGRYRLNENTFLRAIIERNETALIHFGLVPRQFFRTLAQALEVRHTEFGTLLELVADPNVPNPHAVFTNFVQRYERPAVRERRNPAIQPRRSDFQLDQGVDAVGIRVVEIEAVPEPGVPALVDNAAPDEADAAANEPDGGYGFEHRGEAPSRGRWQRIFAPFGEFIRQAVDVVRNRRGVLAAAVTLIIQEIRMGRLRAQNVQLDNENTGLRIIQEIRMGRGRAQNVPLAQDNTGRRVVARDATQNRQADAHRDRQAHQETRLAGARCENAMEQNNQKADAKLNDVINRTMRKK